MLSGTAAHGEEKGGKEAVVEGKITFRPAGTV